MKTEVYSWRVSAELKTDLEREARRRKMSLSSLLDLAAREWLNETGAKNQGDEEQVRLQRTAVKYFGALTGSDPYRSEKVRKMIRKRVQRRHGR